VPAAEIGEVSNKPTDIARWEVSGRRTKPRRQKVIRISALE